MENKLSEVCRYIQGKDISTHNKIIGLWLMLGGSAEEFPKLPPEYMNVLITLKNGKSYKSFRNECREFIVNRSLRERLYINEEEIVKWEFI